MLAIVWYGVPSLVSRSKKGSRFERSRKAISPILAVLLPYLTRTGFPSSAASPYTEWGSTPETGLELQLLQFSVDEVK
jgi:hypothetical protein